jgi:molybdate transport system substrate-binding protein
MKSLFRSSLLLMLVAAAAFSASAADIKVFAAASLTDALQTIAHNYESQGHGKIVFNFAGSNVLARQITEGAPADIFLSADEREMDAVAKAGLLANESRRDLLSNTLVVIVPADSNLPIHASADLAKDYVKRIAVGDPETVPAGVYAKSYLVSHGLWQSIQNKITPTENVRAALAAVASGDVEVGIVYKTDALISKRVKIAYEIPAQEAPQILYPIAVVKKTSTSQEVQKFLDYLESPAAGAVFAHYGFHMAGK